MSSRKKSGFSKKLIILIIVILVIAVAAYWFIPQLLVVSIKSETVQKILPPEIRVIFKQAERKIPGLLTQLDLTPEQAKEDIKKIEYEDIDRIMGKLSGKKSLTGDEAAQLVIDEFDFSYLENQKLKRLMPRTFSEKEINYITRIFYENKGKIRFLLPTLKQSAIEMIK